MGNNDETELLFSDSLIDRFNPGGEDNEGAITHAATGVFLETLTVNITLASFTYTNNTLLAYELSNKDKIMSLACPPTLARAIFESGIGLVKLEIMQGNDLLGIFEFDLADDESVLKLINAGTTYELTIAWA